MSVLKVNVTLVKVEFQLVSHSQGPHKEGKRGMLSVTQGSPGIITIMHTSKVFFGLDHVLIIHREEAVVS